VAAVKPLLDDAATYGDMARAAAAFGRRDAATNVARLVLGLVEQEART